MDFIKVIFLAIAQGIAEFLPISSSGHLLVLGDWLGFDSESNMQLNVILHAGTLLAILLFYFRKLVGIIVEPQRRWIIVLVIIGSIPAGVVGVGLKVCGLDELLFGYSLVAGAGFLVTATLLLTVFGLPWKNRNCENAESEALEKMSLKQAFLIGCAQAVAILPGISRSGSTISCGVFAKLSKTDAAEFSFLLAIPAIGGATLLELLKIVKAPVMPSGSEALMLLIGFLVSAAVGYGALAGLIAMLRRGKLGWFAFYLYAAACVVLSVEFIKLF